MIRRNTDPPGGKRIRLSRHGAGQFLQRTNGFNRAPTVLSMDNQRRKEAIAAARHEIARRIARFCTSLSSEEFENLLDRMANIHWKYDVHPNLCEPETTPDDRQQLTE